MVRTNNILINKNILMDDTPIFTFIRIKKEPPMLGIFT